MNTIIRNSGLALLLMILATACGHVQEEVMIRHEVQITIIYASLDRINAEARDRGHRAQVNGFYDRVRNEIWCPNEETSQAFRTCGHELRHVVKGPFHQ